MAVSDQLGDLSSLIPALHLLRKLGYRYLPPSEARALRGGKASRVVLDAVLTEQLRRLNRIVFKGREYPFSEANIQHAVQAIAQIPFDSLIHTNEEVYDLLTLGKSLEQTIEGYTKSFSLKYIDWADPANNVFHVCDEFEVERRHSRQTRRPDLVLFVNGLPLAVIECKRPDLKDAVEQGIRQHLRNQRADEITELFVYSQILLSVSQNRAMYGTVGTPLKFWSTWKEENEKTRETELRRLINEPLTEDQNARLFLERDERRLGYMQRAWRSGECLPSVQDKAIHGLLRPARLLELTYRFIVFDNKEKKVCRYQQYFAVKATMERVTGTDGEGRRQGGVIWHTTGSGKSLSMVMLAKALALEPGIRNPKVVLVTDRVDLDDQIYRTFKACGKSVVQATSGENLLDLVSHGKATIITTIIDKFETASRKRKVRDEGRDIFVLVDESHRSQYGVAHAKMRGVLPNACYIGFTGTPLLRKEKSTVRKFGGLIHKYTMDQAVRDGAVVPLLYEGRMSELHGDRERIDKWFERITRDLTPEQKADLKKKFRREAELTKSEARIAEIAYDIGRHFKDNFKGTGKKGQLAVSDKATALRYKQCFEEFGDVSVDVVISAPDTRENHEPMDESAVPEVHRFWKSMMAKHGSEKRYAESVVNAFKHSDDPEIIIVVDKLLTGFDAPRNAVLYIDKRLKEHNILQAIARVNRLYEGKDYGLIIDYRGIFGELNEAVDTYAALENEGFDREDVEGMLIDVGEEIKCLSERHANVWEVFKDVGNKKDIEAMQRHLEPEERRQRFYETLSLYAKTLQLALANPKFQDETPEASKQRYVDSLKYFLNLRAAVKQRFGESVDYSAYEIRIRNMVNKYIGAEAVKQIAGPVDLFAVEQLEHELGRVESDDARADVIVAHMMRTIAERMEEDPALYKRLSELTEAAITEHRAKRLSDAEYLARVRRHLDELRGEGAAALPGLLRNRADAGAYYRLIKEPMVKYQVSGRQPEDLAADIAARLEQIIGSHKIRDWVHSVDVQNQMLNDMEDYLFSIKGRYGLDLTYEEIDRLIQQVLAVAKRRDPRA